ncbi:S8 family serine peptidase [Shewanella surugensis]|uniref:S8 family serine peptidase n=1 Tax=Shewanella surugensis TaxID=212020 RepID=A0ABT0LJ85_9GAMM|nr:S8 family serine peptidase [Shewanella surugensis]MCL1127362.1 S8 family serine peptidase [Shewanella surugensis]
MTFKKSTRAALTLSALAIAISANVHAAPSVGPGLLPAQSQQSDAPLPKRYIVKFKDADTVTNGINALSSTSRINPAFSHHSVLNSVKAKEMKRIARRNSYSAKLDDDSLTSLRLRSDVDYVEEDVPRRLLSETTPWGQTYVGATVLSDTEAGNRTICIIDSGYDASHSDLSGNNASGTNNSGTGNWYEPGNNNAHGTHVAGTIAAIANGSGVVGVMPNQNVNIHVIKVFNESGWGYTSELVDAIDDCVDNGANVVTMSLGGPTYSATEKNALAAHQSNGVLLIAAAGNDGDNTHSYPASYDAVMSVASVDNNKDHSDFSQYTDQVEIAGPGTAVLSTVTQGEGVLADITISGQSYFDSGIVPHNRYIQTSGNYVQQFNTGSVTDTLKACSTGSTSYSCNNMNNKICLVERASGLSANAAEIAAAKACYDAGGSAAIVYSNSSLPGLQNPFLVDTDNEVPMVSVSVDRTTGLALLDQVGSSATVAATDGEDYQYYNGTSMATPHVSGVATLVWSHHTDCSSEQIRAALKATAEDLETAGRDDKTGYGLVDAEAADVYLAQSCDGPTDGNTDDTLTNGVAKTGLSGSKSEELYYTFDVPAGATDLSFAMSGGTGDADLYVSFGANPTTSSYDCRSWETGNAESCDISSVETGTYYVMLQGYTAFSGVSLEANYTASSDGGDTGGAATYSNTTSYSIPDNSTTGVSSSIEATRTGDSGTVTVTLDITHTYIGDLNIQLTSPTGQVAVLHDNSGSGTDNISKTYSVDYSGGDSNGTWSLKAVDNASQDTGSINSWSISFE